MKEFRLSMLSLEVGLGNVGDAGRGIKQHVDNKAIN